KALKALDITEESYPQVVADINLKQMIRTGTNVVAGLQNGAPLTIVLGAHLDHLGYGEDENSRHTGEPDIHNGADDNASGTAALLELARLLKEKGDKRFNYLFVHFSGEELGLYGSKYFTEHPPIDLTEVSYMINMDMVGRFNDSSKALTVGGIGTSPAWSTIVTPTSEFLFKIDSSGTGPSDHTSFYRKDIPVLFFFTGLHTDYHKPSDDADRINYGGMVKIVRYIDGMIARTPPGDKLAFTKTREQSMGGRGFKVSIGIMPDYTWPGTGVKADGVIEGRPAHKAGLQANDIILQLGEHLITGVDTYMQALNRFEKGETTTIVIRRGNDVKEMPITF
ncbi:MAG TPA: M20/M25/M40 family metallo-hydrolase, partial [Phnomibacter sp.]|nr:M20/M25/M40 family metallo-hydrolase [Phnomibacter sp.]